MPELRKIRVKPQLAIVCDDIRREANGKQLLIGMYLGGMTLESDIPADADEVHNINIFLWIPCEFTEVGEASFEIKLVPPNPKLESKIKGKIKLDKLPNPTEIVPLVVGPIPLKLWQSGNLDLYFKNESDETYQLLRSVPITFNALPSPEIDTAE